ncbi:adenomatous polyposis coli protein [Caerostris extrusa]|uniref:Adenomatous polyposis coli protein n=1 Tax=Caerostris extrusa TaxID=172846 RepID=A0AAV4T7I3_CAEEX|nr:adenomatous polyposis coli protein [Caerostris extrusa]
MGAVAMLRKLVNSRHKMISMGSSAALKNLLSARPPGAGLCLMAEEGGVFRDENAPSLSVRKQKALSTEIDQNLSETYDNTDSPKTSPVKHAENTQGRSRRHISPSAARYLANQRLKSELTLPSKEEQSMTGSFVVEEKHNGAFQVTKNAKQALNYRQGQQAKLQVNPAKIPEPDSGPKLSFKPIKTQEPKIPDVPTTYESGSKLMFKPAKLEGPKLQNHIPEPGSKLSFRPARYDREVPKPSDDMARQASRSMSPMTVRKGHSAPPSRAVEQARTAPEANQKPMHESRIPLPKSSASRLECQRSQSASPVAPRKNLRQENTSKGPSQKPQQAPPPPVDITVTHPKWAWSASPEKSDNVPECPSKRLDEEEWRGG